MIADSATPSGIIAPHAVISDFLDSGTAAALHAYALANEAIFRPTKVGRDPASNPNIRVSLGTRDLGAFGDILAHAVRSRLPWLFIQLGMPRIENCRIELELVAHNDGAYFRRHKDTQTSPDANAMRILSGVYYVHTLPKAFSGGAFRLHAIGGPGYLDVEPAHNSLLAFPSWAPHEVMDVSCPARRFADSRFAVNCWVHRPNNRG